MKKIIEYNISNFDIHKHNLKDVYLIERNACFGAVYKDELKNVYYAMTDHLGNVPIFYKIKCSEEPVFSLNLMDFLNDSVSEETLKRYLATGSLRFLCEENIFCVPAGNVLSFSNDTGKWVGSLVVKYNWNFNIKVEKTKEKIIDRIDYLLDQATDRLLKPIESNKKVSLALSGGIDSAITAYYLKKKNIEVNAYTVSPWGKEASEAIKSIKTFEKLKLNSHSVYCLETEKYNEYLNDYKKVYPYPNGSVASLTISAMWNNTDIDKNNAVFFAQNADTLFCGVIHQFMTYFYMKVPKFIRNIFHIKYFDSKKDLIDNYVYFISLANEDIVNSNYLNLPISKNDIQKLTFAGMLWGHTPSDGAVFISPSIYKNINIKNLFYDVDLIEYVLQLPLRNRFSFSKESKIKVALSKRLLIDLAKKLGLADDYEKKGLVLPKKRDENSKKFFEGLPSVINGISLINENHRFAVKVLDIFKLKIK